MDQGSRIAELDRFKKGEINILVASDVAARGLDIKGVSHVFNFDTPWHPDDYIHRIGRTGRAGAKGRAFTLVTPEDEEAIANVEKLTGLKIPVFDFSGGEGDVAPAQAEAAEAAPAPRERKERRRREKPAESERDEPRQVREAEEPRQPRRDRAAKPAETKRPQPEDDEGGEPGDWNGPVPSFLAKSAL
jgi:superfamily II DNA/RNA helicase